MYKLHLFYFDYTAYSTKLRVAFTKVWMLAFCGLLWWRKQEITEETIALDRQPYSADVNGSKMDLRNGVSKQNSVDHVAK